MWRERYWAELKNREALQKAHGESKIGVARIISKDTGESVEAVRSKMKRGEKKTGKADQAKAEREAFPDKSREAGNYQEAGAKARRQNATNVAKPPNLPEKEEKPVESGHAVHVCVEYKRARGCHLRPTQG